ncbi:AAA family ATPase [Corallococcus sp. CA047B]|uniref:BTAD domain-containing putative transcriptional regulator n=1 Tax=Corallococcus sp. CA047B TaxID=2316729 RepID=UPI000EA3D7FD|nr:BTAD domain-containing putative transcriptional regulator [Corallococcus sp. CA047B]RKH19834.1 AAA family ATPase [Corallococcus sp. CA047B]
MRWRVQVLGLAQLWGPEGQRIRLERRAAALLAWLGLKGPSPKFALAALLWPDSSPTTARNNMRQLLRRLRLASGGEALVEGDTERLALVAPSDVDVACLKAAIEAQAYERALESVGAEGSTLLAGFDFDDGPELARWLDGARAGVEGWVREAREARIGHLTSGGDWTAALGLAQAWARQEPESEQAGRHLIRLHYLQGDRGAALAAFEQLRSVLSRELGVPPLPETLALVREVEKGTQRPSPTAVTRTALPLSVLRPPVLAGRDAAWRQLEAGWEAGQMLFISGDPGSGKTRLAEEFASSKGRWGRIEARVGDSDVPFASQARAFRTQMARWPDVKLPDWVRTELSRILPELGETRLLPPLDSETGMLRFYDAGAVALQLLHEHEDISIADDVQYWDAASSKAFFYGLPRMFEAVSRGAQPLRFIDCYRRDELSAQTRNHVARLLDAGLARIVDLEALTGDEVKRMVAAMGLPGAEAHAEDLTRYTGGNPLYVVETLKHLLETDSLQRDWPQRLPPPGRVGPLIQLRLERLSALALQCARLAALAGAFFRTSLVPRVLQVTAASAHEALAELESAQVLMAERFSHDLVMEAVRAAMEPGDVRVLHGRLATALEEDGAPAILLAHHWLEAGRVERALPHLLASAHSDEQVLPPEEAAEHYARAAALMSATGQQEDAARARAAEARCRLQAAAASPLRPVQAPPGKAR